MEHNKDETTWFDGVTWVDVCTEAGNSITKIPCTADVYSNETEKSVVGGSELKLGMLLFFPVDIVVDILSRLPVEDLIRARIVCKSWYRLTKDPYFIHMQVSKATNQPGCLLLEQTTYHCGVKLIMVDSENDKWLEKNGDFARELPWRWRGKYCSHLDRILVLDCMNETFQTISFPPVVPEDIELINLGGSLALSELCRFNSSVLRTWQILGSSKDSGRLRQYSFDISSGHGMLSNGDFLYKTFETGNVNSSSLRFYLVCYSPQKKTRYRH
ncbi:hypothetical protein FRX31_011092 [Thalictrum thalictroides]|uniref:F-box domain-containing protein n=1 Tax=Thalictrum thalictroides TaxID=46969 RepID=A0A7J6WRV1_THATH|nr:hypothetical protein FRX31_011092 [Thalictrum thalictroides]